MNFSRYYRQPNLLFSPDLIQRVVTHTQKHCKDTDFPVSKGLSARDEAQRAFRIARAEWQACNSGAPEERQMEFVCAILSKVLGYDTPKVCPPEGITAEGPAEGMLNFAPHELSAVSGTEANEHRYPVTLILGTGTGRDVLPVIVVPPNVSLDAKYSFKTGQRLTATQVMQGFLNASQYYLWALVTNGSNWRLLCDNPALSRPCYLDVDLDLLLQEDDSQAFDGIFWRMLHCSRAARREAADPASCLWEEWRQDLEEHGARARDSLRDGVEHAICTLGTGFLRGTGPGNDALRDALRTGSLNTQVFYQQLMRLAYRLIFLTVLEDRKLLHEHDTTLKTEAGLYRKGYSLARLVQRSLRGESQSRHDDLWQAQLIVFKALSRDGGLPALALPALGGLFDPHQCPQLDACRLPNSAFLEALKHLRWSETQGKRTQIDFNNMDAEELGSVYESLLELTPRVSAEQQCFYFLGGSGDLETAKKKQKGNARKTTGSYYTPACLVDQVLKTSLDPLLDECCKNPVFAQSNILALRVIDPSCGSGHFLLAAARRMAERLASMRTQGQIGYTPEVYHRAMHEVIRHCIYGVDINPMAVELVRMNLWLEGYEPGKALSFLDDHLRCGNSLLGIFSRDTLNKPIPEDAYKCLPGDKAELCKLFKSVNRKYVKERDAFAASIWNPQAMAHHATAFREDQPSQVRAEARAWAQEQERLAQSPEAVAADIWLGSFLVPKQREECIPTTRVLDDFMNNACPADNLPVRAAREACKQANAFHWFLAFPEILDRGGFDCVVGNPPWERAKIQEKEWFANRCAQIADALNSAARKKLIDALGRGELRDMDISLQKKIYGDFQQDLRIIAAGSIFFHITGENGGRFPLSGKGDVNLYALFAETSKNLCAESGRSSFIVPTGIATDAATSTFFGHLVKNRRISSIYDFENREKLFPSVDSRQRFSCFTLAKSDTIDVACYMTNTQQLEDRRRHARLEVGDFAGINPNTGTCPLFRCEADAELAVKLYKKAPILINDKTGENSWKISFCRSFDMSNDSRLFLTQKPENAEVLPLYEGKLIHLYDHRFNTFTSTGGNADVRDITEAERTNPAFELSPRYWVKRADVISKSSRDLKTTPQWFMGFRNICRATDERTLIISFLPFAGTGDTLPLIFLDQRMERIPCFIANANSLVLDYVARQKVGGVHMNYFYFKQFPFLPPDAYSETEISYISNRVLELSYTSYSMKPLAKALGYTGDPFTWDENRRAQLKAELDAYYAKLYGLTREELAYILDPTTKYPKDCPTVTFPTLQNNEMKKYGEYRTQRLVLGAFDELTKQGM